MPVHCKPFGPLVQLLYLPLACLSGELILFAFHLVERWIRAFDLPQEPLLWCAVAAAVVGLIGSHLFSVVFYFPDNKMNWSAILDARTGMSSFGGLIAGGAAAIVTLRLTGLSVLGGLDMLAYGFVGGYVFGRAGCFSIHDHPGVQTDFFMAVPMNGVMRHDLGFYEMWLMSGFVAGHSFYRSARFAPPRHDLDVLFCAVRAHSLRI